MFPVENLGTLERYRVPVGTRTPLLANIDTRDNEGMLFLRTETEASTALDIREIRHLQEILYAEAAHAVLVVLQGLDTSGKDGTIRKVFGSIPPLGIAAISFKKPTSNELAHDFLWRIHRAVPPVGMMAIFNRSHYEDVLVARVHNLVESKDALKNAIGPTILGSNGVVFRIVLELMTPSQCNIRLLA